MGYEIRLRVVHPYSPSPEWKRGKPYIEGEGKNARLEFEWVKKGKEKDGSDKYVETGRTEISMGQVATIDLCKMGEGPFMDMVTKHQLKRAPRNAVYKWFGDDGNTLNEEDSYGTYCKPVKLEVVLKALEAERAKEEKEGDYRYRRLTWALDLLRSMVKTPSDEFMVVFEGH